MHDSLRYMREDPIHRRYHHGTMTFGMIYAYSENFVLPLSHDEVVHGKGSILGKMPGDAWQRFANLRDYYAFMWAHPGKKLLFMGSEIGQPTEWDHDGSVVWDLLDRPEHAAVQTLIGDLNRIYIREPALQFGDVEPSGFEWAVVDDAGNSVLGLLRSSADQSTWILAVSNFTPIPRHGYRIGVPRRGLWREILNTDAREYGGSGVTNGECWADDQSAHGRESSINLVLPPLATVFLRWAAE